VSLRTDGMDSMPIQGGSAYATRAFARLLGESAVSLFHRYGSLGARFTRRCP